MPAAPLIDTDVLVDYLRRQPLARGYLQSLASPGFLSVITVAELHQGIRDDREEREVETLLAGFQILAVDEAAARQAGRFRRQYSRSHGVGFGDCLIAGTAMVHGLRLVTLNARHFPMLTDVVLPYRKSPSA